MDEKNKKRTRRWKFLTGAILVVLVGMLFSVILFMSNYELYGLSGEGLLSAAFDAFGLAVLILLFLSCSRIRPDGLERLLALAESEPAWQEAPEFAPVCAYRDGLAAVRAGEGARALEAFAKLEQKPLRLGAAEQLKTATASLTGEKALLAAVMAEYSVTDEVRFSAGADTVKGALMQSASSGGIFSKLFRK